MSVWGAKVNLLILEFMEPGTTAALYFWHLFLSQLLHLCLQGGQLLLQSLRDTNCFRRALQVGQCTCSTACITGTAIKNVFDWYRKAQTSAVFSLAEPLSCAACRLSSNNFSIASLSCILENKVKQWFTTVSADFHLYNGICFKCKFNNIHEDMRC